MKICDHVFDRMTIRLSEAEELKVIHAINIKWDRLQDNMAKDFAIVALNLENLRMTDTTGWGSNGQAVVGVVRKGTLMTVMLRRFNQPMTPDALRVGSVKWAIKIPREASKLARKCNRNKRKRW